MFDNWFHRYPKDRSWFERNILRKIILAPTKKLGWQMSPPPSRFGTSKYHDARKKRNFPIRFAVAEFFEKSERFFSWRLKRKLWEDPIWWVRHRITNRYNIIRIHSLKPGYYDADERMLHACFNLLVDFVEIELAAANWNFEGKKKRRVRIGHARNRCPEAGVDHLQWEINDSGCNMGSSPTQADMAREKLALYLWWTETRPARVDPWSDPGIWAEWRAKHKATTDLDDADFMRVGEPHQRAGSLEKFYEDEDQEMLGRLVKLRGSLWT